MKAGLSPGQVRPGLHLLREMMRLLERFASRLVTSIISWKRFSIIMPSSMKDRVSDTWRGKTYGGN